jgi:hypothetical protein
VTRVRAEPRFEVPRWPREKAEWPLKELLGHARRAENAGSFVSANAWKICTLPNNSIRYNSQISAHEEQELARKRNSVLRLDFRRFHPTDTRRLEWFRTCFHEIQKAQNE